MNLNRGKINISQSPEIPKKLSRRNFQNAIPITSSDESLSVDNQIANPMICSADSESDVVERTTDSIAPAADSISASQAEQIEESKAPTEYRKRKQIKEEEMKEEDKEMVYYPSTRCKCCVRLAKTEFVPMPDDEDYTDDTDRIREPGLRLRMIHYSRAFAKSGGFEVECPPRGCFGGVYNIDHFPYPETLTDRKLAEHAINMYEDNKSKKLKMGKIVSVTASRGMNMVYYLTFEGLDSENLYTWKTMYNQPL